MTHWEWMGGGCGSCSAMWRNSYEVWQSTPLFSYHSLWLNLLLFQFLLNLTSSLTVDYSSILFHTEHMARYPRIFEKIPGCFLWDITTQHLQNVDRNYVFPWLGIEQFNMFGENNWWTFPLYFSPVLLKALLQFMLEYVVQCINNVKMQLKM